MLFSTKAQTLEYLKKNSKNYDYKIPKLLYFTINDYSKDKKSIIKLIKFFFKSSIIVRSSSIFEDTNNNSLAGSFDSVLNVDIKNTTAIEASIEKVVKSFDKKRSLKNQILIQDMVENVKMTGVATSGDKDNLSSYYIIDYV